MDAKQPAIYILANERNGTLYIGVTSNLVQRVWQHRNSAMTSFSKRYQLHRLVYYEMHESMDAAILREKQIKKWNRSWKVELVEKQNPYWNDLFPSIV